MAFTPSDAAPAPRRRTYIFAIAACFAIGASLLLVVRTAGRERQTAPRCPAGLVPLEARCCGAGQTLVSNHCSGSPSTCAGGMRAVAGVRGGCVVGERRVSFTGGVLTIAHSDWDPRSEVEPRAVRIGPFELDAHEVTLERWQRCVTAGGCRSQPLTEPGQPVTTVAPAEALQFCRFFGGRLPTADEWLYAAAGPKNRRFPWGETGLVCRRVAFGLAEGPCAEGGTTPEVVGSRPDGRTPEGLFDMAGNVAEWTLEAPLKDSRGRPEFAARGGSFRSRVATELKSWSMEMTDRPAPHIGFRCAYSSE